MTVSDGGGLLRQWRDADARPRRRGRQTVQAVGELRFAFYGRFSTREHQDSNSSRRWQLECADQVIAGFGSIVAEFLDVGVTRRRSWVNRPQAAALLDAVTAGAPGFDAVVVGEYERAFCGRQAFEIIALLHEHGVALWLPETLGPVDLGDPAHRAVLIEIGARSMREIQRDRHRAIEAMSAQARYQGRYLGGRPPYGYLLVDAGPHPTASHARWGRQQQRLAPDPATAVHVRWIFARRLEGCSMKSIARGLNDRGVPCPSAYDRARNRHRSSTGWGCTTVAAILANPRYTGRQVWNRQPTQHHDTARDVGGRARGRRRSSRRDWVISDRIAHEALVTEADFIAVQAVTALARPADGIVRSYQLVGVLRCAVCDRRMISHWAHDRAWYRCRHGYPSTPPGAPARPGSLYLREDRLLVQIKAAMPASWGSETPESSAVAEYLRLHRLIAVCDATTVVLEPE